MIPKDKPTRDINLRSLYHGVGSSSFTSSKVDDSSGALSLVNLKPPSLFSLGNSSGKDANSSSSGA